MGRYHKDHGKLDLYLMMFSKCACVCVCVFFGILINQLNDILNMKDLLISEYSFFLENPSAFFFFFFPRNRVSEVHSLELLPFYSYVLFYTFLVLREF